MAVAFKINRKPLNTETSTVIKAALKKVLLYNVLKKAYETQVPSEGLAVFRIAYGTILFFEALQIFYFRHLIFDPIPYIQFSETVWSLSLSVWLLVILCLILGAFTKYVKFINLAISFTTISVFTDYEYHLDYSMIGMNFLLLFLPVSKSFSLDRYLQASIYNETDQDTNVSLISYYLPVLLGIGVVYFDSIFWKFGSYNWTHGLGFWLPSSLPISTYLDLSFILNNKFLSLSLGYITLIFELIFIFFIWNIRFRPILTVIGLGLHIGILFCYPIPLFALGAVTLYILLLPPNLWKKLIRKTSIFKIKGKYKKAKESENNIYVNFQRKYGFKIVYAFIAYCLCFQAICILSTPIIGTLFTKLGLDNLNTKIYNTFSPINNINVKLFGITSHPVFMDSHWNGYNHIIAITYIDKNNDEIWLPINSEDGQPSYYNTGRQWVRWTFRANNPNINQEALIDGIKEFTAFWAHKNSIDLSHAVFKIKVKRLEIPSKWEKEFLQRQMNKPWMDVGKARWHDRKYSIQIPNIESL